MYSSVYTCVCTYCLCPRIHVHVQCTNSSLPPHSLPLSLLTLLLSFPFPPSFSYNVPRLRDSSRVNGILVRYDNDTSIPRGESIASYTYTHTCTCTCTSTCTCTCTSACTNVCDTLYMYMYVLSCYMYMCVWCTYMYMHMYIVHECSACTCTKYY